MSGYGYSEGHGAPNTVIIAPTRHRTLFLSDFHLGSRACQAKRLYEFLCRNDADTIYLIGDILEGGILHRWPPFHDQVLQILAEKSLAGTRLIFIPGNHDALFRQHIGTYGNLKIANHAIHEQVAGKTLLVVHGDETDLCKLDILLWMITKFENLTKLNLWELMRKHFGSLIRQHTTAFENKIMAMALERGFLGVVCGHVHMPRIADRGALYLNPGDWTWHCTAIAEDAAGNFKLLQG
jgi:UDP-2,3-diacylglucosamine pyrophosphatase LpxH